MAKKKRKKRGRPPKHGGYSLLTRAGELPENRKHVRDYLSSVREGLIQDLGPNEEDLTTAQKVLVDRVVSKLGIVRCIEEYIKEKGVFSEENLTSPLKNSYLAYNNSIRLDLQSLGINESIQGKALPPEQLAKEISKESKNKKDKKEAK